jgi:hypothetical protein
LVDVFDEQDEQEDLEKASTTPIESHEGGLEPELGLGIVVPDNDLRTDEESEMDQSIRTRVKPHVNIVHSQTVPENEGSSSAYNPSE